MLKDELLKNIGKTMNINTKRKTKYDFKNLKLVGVYYDEDYLETWDRIKLIHYDTKKTRTIYSKKGYHVYPVY